MVELKRPIRVFCSYAHEDYVFFDSLKRHLTPLIRSGAIQLWDDSLVPMGEIRSEYVDKQLDESEIIILVLSSDFLASDICDLTMQRALLRRGRDQADVVPILARPVSWEWTPLSDLQVLPDNGRAITSWSNPDEAWTDVARGLHRIILSHRTDEGSSFQPSAVRPTPAATSDSVSSKPDLGSGPPPVSRSPEVEPTTDLSAVTPSPPPPPRTPLPIHEIFRTTGQPDVNFVEPQQLGEIKIRLRMMGQGLVVQGPSGVGKTTAVRRCLNDLVPEQPVVLLSSKKPADIKRLTEIIASSFADGGHLLIDDFHRLAPDLQQQVTDLMKILADENRTDAKITLIGINPVGVSLVRNFPDLANRFAVISMGKQPPDKIDELIKKGAQAANVRFERHAEFVKEAAGSFFTAQLLCLEAALKEGVTETSASHRVIVTGPSGYVMDKVQQSLAFKYHAPLMAFATCDEKPPPRGASLALLWLLSRAEDVSVSLEAARYRYPQLAPAFAWLMASNLWRHFEEHPRLRDLFHYNRDAAVLSAEDPQLEFYLRNLRWEAFARDTGHENLRWDVEKGPLVEGVSATAAVTITAEGPQEPTPWPLPESQVLHLSDLHFGTRADAALWADQLTADLQRELNCRRLDGVILSGDIANFATAEEYQAASQFLLMIKQEFRLSPQQIILVPGNHDVSWEVAKSSYSPHRRSEYKGPLEEGQFIDGGAYIEARDGVRYRQRFAPFADFYREIRMEAYPLEYEQQATLHYLQAQKLLILGLNSAWAIDHHYRSRAGIHQVALGQALRLVRTTEAYAECLKIAVWHHPVHSPGEDRIKDTGFMERLAQEGFRLGLHGHVHKADNGLFRYDMSAGGRRIDLLCAGTFGAPVKEWTSGVPLQYQLLKFAGDKVVVETRRREELNGAWKPDARWMQGSGEDPRPRYEITLS